MRLLHLKTLEIVTKADDSIFKNVTSSRKAIISHAWSEVFKFLGSGQSHPKMFIVSQEILGAYLWHVKQAGDKVGCNLDGKLVTKYDLLYIGFCNHEQYENELNDLFDDLYLFSDANSLYYKGVNIFPILYGDKWRKYVPVESIKEIHRQIEKTLGKGDKSQNENV